MAIGVYNTGLLAQDLARKSFASSILRKMPNGSAPLTALTALLKEETALQIEHGFYAKTMVFPSANVTVAGIAGDVTVTVDSTAPFIVGMILRVPATGENVLITSINSGTVLGIRRAFGGIAAGAIANGAALYMVGNASEEASLRPSSVIIIPDRLTNYTQIFRNTWAVSETTRATQLIAGDSAVAESRVDCGAFHAADIEKATIFGQKYQGVYQNQPIHTMDGLLAFQTNQAPGNSTTLGATTTYTQLQNALDVTANVATDPKGGNERLLFVGGVGVNVLHQIFRLNSQYQMINGDPAKAWGMRFMEFRIPRMNFTVIEHPLLNAYGQASAWAKMGFAVDLSTFNHAYLQGRKTTSREFNTDGKAVDNGIDAVGGTLTSELTALVKNPAANAVLNNFTAGAQG